MIISLQLVSSHQLLVHLFTYSSCVVLAPCEVTVRVGWGHGAFFLKDGLIVSRTKKK